MVVKNMSNPKPLNLFKVLERLRYTPLKPSKANFKHRYDDCAIEPETVKPESRNGNSNK